MDTWLETSEWTDRFEGNSWHVWLRSDLAHTRARFVFVRSVKTQEQMLRLIEAITDKPPATVEFDAAQFEAAWKEEEADCQRRYTEYCQGARWPR